MNMLHSILYDLVYHSTPLILAVLGGLFAYQANVLNIGLEGMMLMGAFSSSLFVLLTGSLWQGILLSILCTLALGLVFSLFSVTLKSNFIITGFGINLFASAFSSFILKYMRLANINVSSVVDVPALKIHIPVLADIPILGSLLSGHTPITYLSLLLILVVHVVLYKTKLGVYVRVVGKTRKRPGLWGSTAPRSVPGHPHRRPLLCLAGANLSTERMALFTSNMTAGGGLSPSPPSTAAKRFRYAQPSTPSSSVWLSPWPLTLAWWLDPFPACSKQCLTWP